MAPTERDQTAMPPKSLAVGSFAKDLERNKDGRVMGHLGADRVQLRPIGGGTEWDAFKVRPLTESEQSRLPLKPNAAAGKVVL
ncbi:hypothetical protein [Streptomyces sp. RP5T]|uniref:hypothetical protein n=1 Tax=Streptomyces sp. RP5T TaxID=2490848 RepID=UPI000F64712F|nr:hypothetical protein [Streptomyces sp. RP5T]RRR84047.1 hypothetical protein EHS43_12970 [Streptomyces sp. RP5T]